MENYRVFKCVAKYCVENFGCTLIFDKDKLVAFVCPDCGEPLYYEDFKDTDWTECPVCGTWFKEGL